MKTISQKYKKNEVFISSGKNTRLPTRSSLQKNNVSLVLSGGGIHGLAHIGVLEKIVAHDISFSEVIGCSIGSLVGVCLAAGKTVSEIEEFFFKTKVYSYFTPSLQPGGLVNSERLVKAILTFIDAKTFGDLKMPFKVNATNVNTGKEKVFFRGDLLIALRASITFPGVFSPVAIGKSFFIDGGVASVVPVHLANPKNHILAIDVSRRNERIDSSSSALQVMESGLMLMQQDATEREVLDIASQTPLILVRPNVSEFLFFDIRKSVWKDVFERGVVAGRFLFRQL